MIDPEELFEPAKLFLEDIRGELIISDEKVSRDAKVLAGQIAQQLSHLPADSLRDLARLDPDEITRDLPTITLVVLGNWQNYLFLKRRELATA